MVNKIRDFYTLKELADLLGISRIAVYKKVRAGTIKAYRLGKIYCIPKEEFTSLSGTTLNASQKKVIAEGVKKTVMEYQHTLDLLGSG